MTSTVKVLFVTPLLPSKASSGGFQVTLERLCGLASNTNVELHTLCISADVGRRWQDNESVRVHAAAGSVRDRSIHALIGSYACRLPLSVYRNTVPALTRLARRLSTEKFDLVYVDHWLVWQAAALIPTSHRILQLHNAEPALFERGAERLGLLTRYFAKLEARRAAAYIRSIVNEIDELHLLSADDARELNDWGIRHRVTRIFYPSAESDTRAQSEVPQKNHALFVGSLSWHPNSEGIHWFIRRVLPLLPSSIRVEVAGAGASSSLVNEFKSLSDRVQFHGFVDDLEELYIGTRCFFAPLLSGSGVKLKILNALARGIPVVTTSIGVEGFPSGYETAVRVADDAAQFADHIVSLVRDDFAWQKAQLAAIAYVERHFRGRDWMDWCRQLTNGGFIGPQQ